LTVYATTTFKLQKGSKDIIKLIHVTNNSNSLQHTLTRASGCMRVLLTWEQVFLREHALEINKVENYVYGWANKPPLYKIGDYMDYFHVVFTTFPGLVGVERHEGE